MNEENLALSLAARLRQDILRGRLLPGDKIKERDTAAQLGVSRTPLREAIRILADSGLVELRHSRSPVVASPSYEELADEIELLIALEGLAAQRGCDRASAAQLSRITDMLRTMSDMFTTLDPIDFFELDMQFHCAIVEASGNGAIVRTHRTYLERLWRARFLAASQHQNRARALEEHKRIADALVDRDKDAARAAVHAHLVRLPTDIRPIIEAEQSGRTNPV